MYTFFMLGLLVGLFFNLGMEFEQKRSADRAQFVRWYNANSERLREEGIIRVD